MKRYLYLLVSLCLLSLSACSDSELEGWNPVSPNDGSSSATSYSISVDNGTVNATSVSTVSTVHITCDGQWTATSGEEWITLSSVSGTGDADITLTIAENQTPDTRTGSVSLSSGTNKTTVNVMQDGRYLTLSAESLSFETNGGTAEVTVSTDGAYSATTEDGWLSVSINSNIISIAVTVNTTTSSRSGKVTVALTGLTSGSLSREIVVSQKEGAPREYPVAEAIDLGLPSGTLWASWNLGASKPEEYGGYFAWGETEEKDYYNWITYIHCSGTQETCYHIGDDIAGTEYDVAHVKWGGKWQMPTSSQSQELVNNCSKTWTTMNGVNGILVSGPNGNTLFLPAAGYRWYGELSLEGTSGHYWSSSLNTDYEYYARYLLFSSDYCVWSLYDYFYYGHTVRAVCP